MKKELKQIAEIKISYHYGRYFANDRKISNSNDTYNILKQAFEPEMCYRESFYILLLNRANNVLGISKIADGGTASVVVDIKLIFQRALKANASCIILAHNHPSGNLTPSEQDRKITQTIKKGAALLDMTLLDHIILAHTGYYSFADKGIL